MGVNYLGLTSIARLFYQRHIPRSKNMFNGLRSEEKASHQETVHNILDLASRSFALNETRVVFFIL